MPEVHGDSSAIHALGSRKIVHVDMDAFYASVEQRDDPNLRGRLVVVAWKGKRSVVCAASYEARRFGVRSAMPAVTAERMCPEAIFVAPDFVRYKAVSQAVREIFRRHTDAIEPLSLDEAYLDVTENKTELATQRRVPVRPLPLHGRGQALSTLVSARVLARVLKF
jgi:DNA polymerase IV